MDSRIVAVDHVYLEASRDALDQLTWFYGELAQLDAVDDVATKHQVCFRSARLELRVRLVDTPRGESVACRVTILVDCLED
ncbi:MAG: hypothetical protein HY763_09165, partial [Planctomycetes bacterium]|nr:hypothetical protein [Planctomycetota bacterium]